jgi:flagellin
MAVVIGTNAAALLAAHHLNVNRTGLDQAMTRLASGKRINSAADDPGSIGVAASLLAGVKGAQMAKQNANAAIAAVTVADSAMIEVENMLQRIRELKVQSLSTGTYSATDITNMNSEITQLSSEIDDIASNTKFNGTDVSSLAVTPAVRQDGSTMTMTLPAFLSGATSVDSASNVTQIDTAINLAASARGSMGAFLNRLTATVNNLSSIAANTEAAYSKVMDTDYAAETAAVAKGQVLAQAGAAVLAQANASQQYVLTLLQ